MKIERFKVDVRVACAAIIDTFWPNINNGLDADAPYVIEYTELPREETDDDKQERLIQLVVLEACADQMNINNTTTREQFNELVKKLTNISLELEEVFADNPNFTNRHLRDLIRFG